MKRFLVVVIVLVALAGLVDRAAAQPHLTRAQAHSAVRLMLDSWGFESEESFVGCRITSLKRQGPAMFAGWTKCRWREWDDEATPGPQGLWTVTELIDFYRLKCGRHGLMFRDVDLGWLMVPMREVCDRPLDVLKAVKRDGRSPESPAVAGTP